jgi:hypothetical protein
LDRTHADHAIARLIGMIRSPHATLSRAVARPRSFDLAVLILGIVVVCSVGFLMTSVGRLAALDQQVRILESLGAVVTDDAYDQLRRWQPYRPALNAGVIVAGWPLLWICAAAIISVVGHRAGQGRATFGQVLTVLVHASAVFAVRALIATPIDYQRESLGGSTSLFMLMPGFGESSFGARLLAAVDIFAVWWVVLVAMGLSILYQTRTIRVARWLFGAYAAGVATLALTQALRGGI